MATLSIAVVTYKPDIHLLYRCIKSINNSVVYAKKHKSLTDACLMLVDNSSGPGTEQAILKAVNEAWDQSSGTTSFTKTPRNLGYGIAHNIPIKKTTMDFHLILNPDVLLDEPSFHEAIKFMDSHGEAVLVTPSAINDRGYKEYLNKRYPDILTLLVKGFAPQFVKKFFYRRIAHYEIRDKNQNKVQFNIPLASGCFMFFRSPVLTKLEGFSEKFFLYFEDYDLSIRAKKYGSIVYVPTVKIVHFGGNTARKGIKHITLFARSAIIFFNLFGWKWW